MTLKSLLFKVFIVIVTVIILFIGWMYLNFRKKNTDLAKVQPYTTIVGTTQTTKQVCFIAQNYEASVKENPFILQLENNFFSEAGQSYEIPLGTPIKIKKAISITGGINGFTDNMVLGTIFIKELNQEVAFEYAWESEKAFDLQNYNDYQRYPITPWQKEPLPLKYSVEDGSITPYQWPARTNNPNFNTLLATIWCNFKYMGNRDFENTTFEKDRYEQGMHGYYEAFYQITPEVLPLVQLTNIYPDFDNNPSKYIVGKDHRLNLSSNFISLIITVQIDKDIMEQSLINYNLNGDYIDHVALSKASRSNGPLRASHFEGFKIFTETETKGEGKNVDRVNYKITENGTILTI